VKLNFAGGAGSRSRSDLMESDRDLIFLFEHDLFGKPVPAFPDHALMRLEAI
jgi:hypothetical protein